MMQQFKLKWGTKISK